MKREDTKNGFVEVRGAQQNNLRNIDVDIPRNSFVAFTGVSGSGKSSIAFGTIYAEAQRRYFESVAPYARRLIAQLPAPKVSEVRGLPPAVALQQRRGEPTARSSVGTLTTLSNSLRMLFSRAGTYPRGAQRLDSDAFSPNTPEGACPSCHGIGIVHTVDEESLVPDPGLSIKEGAIAAWPGAWQGKNYRDILATLGYDVEKPWKKLPKREREWILFTEEKPVVTVHAIREAHRIQRPYQGTYMSAASYVKHTFATTESATLRKRVMRFMKSADCHACKGKRLRAESLAVHFAGQDIATLGQMPLSDLPDLLSGARELKSGESSEQKAASIIVGDLIDRITLICDLGLGYLAMDRPVPTLSAGELQRLRLTTQLRSGLFGVVYILDEPSAGLHPSDAEALFEILKQLQDSGNSLFIVEHDMELVKQADWIVDIGPGAGTMGGSLLYSGPVAGLKKIEPSVTRLYLYPPAGKLDLTSQPRRKPSDWMQLKDINRHNLKRLSVEFPLGALTVVTGVSGSGKSTLVSQVLVDSLIDKLKTNIQTDDEKTEEETEEDESDRITEHAIVENFQSLKRLVCVDQKPIGRTPRSNVATYTGIFDAIRKTFATTPDAKAKGYSAGRFSFNVAGGRCDHCNGEGFVSIELLFLPSVYAPCNHCHGTRYNNETLQIIYRGLNIAQVLDLTVDSAVDFFQDIASVCRGLKTLQDVGLGYLTLGQPATELSGGEAQRIKLATELQREQNASTIYILDEPTTGLHPADIEKLMRMLHALVDAGNTVIVVEHDMAVVSSADWVIDLGPGAGKEGGKVVVAGPPTKVAKSPASRTGHYLSRILEGR